MKRNSRAAALCMFAVSFQKYFIYTLNLLKNIIFYMNIFLKYIQYNLKYTIILARAP